MLASKPFWLERFYLFLVENVTLSSKITNDYLSITGWYRLYNPMFEPLNTLRYRRIPLYEHEIGMLDSFVYKVNIFAYLKTLLKSSRTSPISNNH